ncbi:MAG: hypothetical protein ACP5QK_12795 [Myxococcota bacterium]
MRKLYVIFYLFLILTGVVVFGCLDLGLDDNGNNCPDGSRCCKTENGVQIVGITVPIDCECPPNTKYLLTDKHYNVKQCDCNDCD